MLFQASRVEDPLRHGKLAAACEPAQNALQWVPKERSTLKRQGCATPEYWVLPLFDILPWKVSRLQKGAAVNKIVWYYSVLTVWLLISRKTCKEGSFQALMHRSEISHQGLEQNRAIVLDNQSPWALQWLCIPMWHSLRTAATWLRDIIIV